MTQIVENVFLWVILMGMAIIVAIIGLTMYQVVVLLLTSPITYLATGAGFLVLALYKHLEDE